MSKISLYDIVKLAEDLPDFGIKAGETGTVVDKLVGDAWLVEFDDVEDSDGFPVALGFASEKLVLVKPFAAMKPPPSLRTGVFAQIRPALTKKFVWEMMTMDVETQAAEVTGETRWKLKHVSRRRSTERGDVFAVSLNRARCWSS